MRELVSGSLGRRISWALVAAFLLPLFVLAMPPKQANAQLTRLHPVAVLDFGVMTSTRTSAILSRNATDAVVVEMSRTGRFDMTPRTQLTQGLSDLGLTMPLNNNGIQKLGQSLGVDYVASGDVTSVSFHDNPRRAVVTLSVRLTDVVSGELANGAIATGFSSPAAPGLMPDDETLINQAISDAAFNAVKTINDYTLPEATILTTRGTDEVTLNRGGRDGITPGQDMTVVRGHERIGRIHVTQVSPNDSIAEITESGKGIRPEDRARAVFRVPGYDVTKDGDIRSSVPDTTSYSSQAGNRSKPILTTIFGVVAAVLIASLIFSSKSNTAGSGVSSVVAQAYAEGSILAATPDTTAPRVKITWRPAADIPYDFIIAYNIYRDGNPIGEVSNPAVNTFIDQANTGFSTVTIFVLSTTSTANNGGSTATGTNSTTTTNGTGTTSTGGTTSFGSTSTGGTSSGSSGSNSSTNTPPVLQPVSEPVTLVPMTIGVPHRYSVSVIYQTLEASVGTTSGSSGGTTATGGTTAGGTTSSTTNSGPFYRESNLNATSGSATPLSRPGISTSPLNPSGKGLLTSIAIPFTPTPGANQYVVEFADNPSFNKKVTETAFYESSSASGTLNSPTFTDLATHFSGLATNAPIFYRIGAKNSVDSPGPTGDGTPNGGNYIYSGTSTSFPKPSTPPGTP